MRKVVAVSVCVLSLTLAWFAYSAWREAGYRTTLTHFQHDLPLGTQRVEVKKYLDSRNLQYAESDRQAWGPEGLHAPITINLGPTTGSIGCTSTAYVALYFSSSESAGTQPKPADLLKQISITKLGRDCW